MPASRNFPRAAIAALFLLAATISPSHAHDGPHEPEPAAGETATVLTNQMLATLRRLQRAEAKDKPQVEQQLLEQIAQRQAALYSIVKSNPEKVLLAALPGSLRAKVPAALAAGLEQEVDATGKVLGRVSDDFANGRTREDFFLEVSASGTTTRLNIDAADASLSAEELRQLVDSYVKIRGVLLKDHLVVGHRRNVETLAAPNKGGGSGGGTSGSTSTTSSTPLAAPVNETTLVIAANFTDKAFSCGTGQVATNLFSADASVASLNRLYRETSRDLVSFSGQVVGPFNIGYSSGGACDYTGWGSALKAAAQAAGINLSSYRRISYAIPPVSSCGWAGLAYLGGSFPTQSWVATCSTGVFVHEIGHNLRFHHAATPGAEYGDGSDPMGGARMVQFNASNRIAAGWQPTGTVVDASSSGSYSIVSTSNTASTAAQILRIAKPDTGEHYYLSLRTGDGFDFNLSSGYKNQISVHRSNGALGSKTYFLAALGPGGTFSDAANGVSVTVQSISGGAATVAVASGTPACTPSAPAVSLSPLSQSGAPGQTRQYTATVTNRNSAACPGSTFSMTQALPGALSGSFAPSAVALAPGASANLTWSVTSATTAADAAYAITASATDSAAGGGSASATGTYVVFSDAVAPVVSVTSPSAGAVLKRGRVSLAASATDSDGVARVEFYANGQLVGTDAGAPYSVNWNARKVSPGQWTITARAFDAAGNVGESSVTIELK